MSSSLMSEWREFLSSIFIPTLKGILGKKHKASLSAPRPFVIRKSGPTTVEDRAMLRSVGNSSFYALVFSAKA